MDFEQLKQVLNLPDNESESNWHRHTNHGMHCDIRPGGWVQNTATVSPWAYVGTDAVVRGNANVLGYSLICDRAQVSDFAVVGTPYRSAYGCVVSDDARISGEAEITVHAKVGGTSHVTDNAVIGTDANIFGASHVSGRARISGNYLFDSVTVGGTTKISSESLNAIGAGHVSGETITMETLSREASKHLKKQQERKTRADKTGERNP
jgi:UDP-3-O-[3-hydroxymyristoyl] glucosamine N-acyltransferase